MHMHLLRVASVRPTVNLSIYTYLVTGNRAMYNAKPDQHNR